ncbi:hypothetical protein [Fibrella arboris]|uniref:hypothetical protein n=1 Tax=Fibrella arboris TaxID=3242486 RepID=UPI0035228A60
MNQYTLDFADPVRPTRRTRPKRWPRQRMYRTFRQMSWLLSGLVCSIAALLGMMRQRTQTQTLRAQYQAQAIQYDSLLAAKVEADRQLQLMRIRLTSSPLNN